MSGCATTVLDPRFDAVVLGAAGGLDESDLTAVLISRAGKGEFIALDAGTLVAGLRRAAARGGIARRPSDLFGRHLHGVFLSHPHLDHVAGLIISSPEAPKLNVFGLAPTLDALARLVFGTALWANFTDEGPGAIGRFHLERMTPGSAVTVAGAALEVEAAELSHAGGVSTAFVVFAGDDAALYLGDVGPDAVEQSEKLKALWVRVAPLIRAKKLRVVFLESSFADPREDARLFGHLTPSRIVREFDALAALAGGDLRGLTLVVTHIKPELDGDGDVRAEVRRQLAPLEQRGVRVIVPVAGERLSF